MVRWEASWGSGVGRSSLLFSIPFFRLSFSKVLVGLGYTICSKFLCLYEPYFRGGVLMGRCYMLGSDYTAMGKHTFVYKTNTLGVLHFFGSSSPSFPFLPLHFSFLLCLFTCVPGCLERLLFACSNLERCFVVFCMFYSSQQSLQ